MKIKKDERFIKYSVYILITAVAIYCSITVIHHIQSIVEILYHSVLSVLGLFMPLIIALVISYLLYPVVHFFEKKLEKRPFDKLKYFQKKNNRRIVGIVVTYLLVIATFSALMVGLYLMIGGQLSERITISKVVAYISDYLNTSTLNVHLVKEQLDSLNISIPEEINTKLAEVLNSLQIYIGKSIGNITSSILSFGSNIASFFISLILSVYLLKDSAYFTNIWNKIFYMIFRKSKIGEKIGFSFGVVNQTFSDYIRGQFLDAFFVGVLSAVGLSLIGIEYAVLIGVFSGICNMVPYVGPVVGTVLAGIMGLLSGEPIMVLWAILVMQIVQQIDNNFLAPRIVGNSVGLHPVFTMLAIIIGGKAAGLVGMLIAVPITASAKILFGTWYRNHIDYPGAEEEE